MEAKGGGSPGAPLPPRHRLLVEKSYVAQHRQILEMTVLSGRRVMQTSTASLVMTDGGDIEREVLAVQ